MKNKINILSIDILIQMGFFTLLLALLFAALYIGKQFFILILLLQIFQGVYNLLSGFTALVYYAGKNNIDLRYRGIHLLISFIWASMLYVLRDVGIYSNPSLEFLFLIVIPQTLAAIYLWLQCKAYQAGQIRWERPEYLLH